MMMMVMVMVRILPATCLYASRDLLLLLAQLKSERKKNYSASSVITQVGSGQEGRRRSIQAKCLPVNLTVVQVKRSALEAESSWLVHMMNTTGSACWSLASMIAQDHGHVHCCAAAACLLPVVVGDQ